MSGVKQRIKFERPMFFRIIEALLLLLLLLLLLAKIIIDYKPSKIALL